MSVESSNACVRRNTRDKRDESIVVEFHRAEKTRPRVLVVEDEPDAQTLVKFMLEPKYEVIAAATGEEMRQRLSALPDGVSLVLMDLKLEGEEDGVQLTRELRADERWKEIPIVALTACSTAEDVHRALEAGCEDYVPKPFYRKQIMALVERMLH